MSQTNLANANLVFQQQLDPKQPAEEPRRSPEVQAEVERIDKADTYFPLDRDPELFDWLNDQRMVRVQTKFAHTLLHHLF